MSRDDELLRLFLATPASAPVVAVSADLTSADLPTSAQPLLRAVQLQPQSGAHYSQLAHRARELEASHNTQIRLFNMALSLLPRDRSLPFALVNAQQERFMALHNSVPGSASFTRDDGMLKRVRKEFLASLRRVVVMEEGRYSTVVHYNMGSVLMMMNRPKESEASFKQALRLLRLSLKPDTPTPELDEEERKMASEVLEGLDLTLAHQRKKRDSLHGLGVALRLWGRPDQRPPRYRPELFACPFYEPALYGDLVPPFELEADAIRREMLTLLRRRADGDETEAIMWYKDHEGIAKRDSQWLRRHVSCEHDPPHPDAVATCGAVRRALRWYYGAASGGTDARIDPFWLKAQYSLLAPGAHVRPHAGPTNDRLAISLGLGGLQGSEIRVGSTWRPWRKNEALLFDDSFEHEVRVRGRHPRAVLIVHVQHPEAMPAGTNGARIAMSDACDVGRPSAPTAQHIEVSAFGSSSAAGGG